LTHALDEAGSGWVHVVKLARTPHEHPQQLERVIVPGRGEHDVDDGAGSSSERSVADDSSCPLVDRSQKPGREHLAVPSDIGARADLTRLGGVAETADQGA